ncbi:MAG: alanyl-tRNA editing protein [Candidatus Krumholzibacteria bacterium]
MADVGTQKLYLQDSYTVSFDAVLVMCEPLSGGGFRAVLDKSYFYPESGGQLADRGCISNVDVTDVHEDHVGRVHHHVEREIEPGAVSCTVDWERRFDHMQQHTGQHVLSRAFIEIAGMDTVSFHMGVASCTIDVEGGALADNVVREAEELANSIIWENRGVKIRTVSPAEVQEPLLRKSLPEGVNEVRLVEVDGFDVIGCCGTHVRSTGELGVLKILRYEKAKGANRVHFRVGRRALHDYSLKHDIVKLLSNRFTTSPGSLVEKVEKIHAEGQSHRKEAQKLARKLVTFEAGSLLEKAKVHNGCKLVAEVLGDASEEHLSLLSAELKKKKGTVSILALAKGLVLCNAAGDVDIDFTEPVIERVKSMGGSGGGKGRFAKVMLPKEVPAAGFVEEILGVIKRKVKRV